MRLMFLMFFMFIMFLMFIVSASPSRSVIGASVSSRVRGVRCVLALSFFEDPLQFQAEHLLGVFPFVSAAGAYHYPAR